MKTGNILKPFVGHDAWASLKALTPARIAIGRTGNAELLKASLEFKLAHAYARDAVFSQLNTEDLLNNLKEFNLPAYMLNSKATNRNEYLQRPDLGRKLNDNSVNQIKETTNSNDIAIIIADGLSATAINNHAVPALQQLVPLLQSRKYTIAPLTLVEHGRVAIADDIGFLLKASLSIILIGERPGLSSPHSMGAYITYAPKPGLTDASRNCISNIHSQGLQYNEAAQRIFERVVQSIT